jgi:hypothetical protein
MHLIEVDAHDPVTDDPNGDQVTADAAAEVQHRTGDVDLSEAACPVPGDDVAGRLFEPVATQQHRVGPVELHGCAGPKHRLLGSGGDEIGRPLRAQSFGDGEIVAGSGQQFRRREQRPQLARGQRRMPASG